MKGADPASSIRTIANPVASIRPEPTIATPSSADVLGIAPRLTETDHVKTATAHTTVAASSHSLSRSLPVTSRGWVSMDQTTHPTPIAIRKSGAAVLVAPSCAWPKDSTV